jgi:lysophospholipase L1-like esterase
MSESGQSAEKVSAIPWRIRIIPVVKIALGATLAFVVCAVVPPWLRAQVTESQFRRIRLGFLTALLSGYLAALAISLVGGVSLGWQCWCQRRRGLGRVHLVKARGLLFCLAMLLALGMAEITAGIWLAWTHRVPVLPVSLPTRFASPEDEAVHIVVVGESSAEGVPYQNWLSVGEIVAWQLRRAIPGRTFRVENQARSGTRLEQMHQRLAGLTHRPDAILIYAGHNEFYARHAWTHEVSPYYLDDQRLLAPEPFRKMAGQFSRLVRLIDEAIDREQVAAPPPRIVRRLIDAPSHTSQEHAELLADFRNRMEAIVSYCRQIGALPILVAPPGNDVDFEPNRSILPPQCPRAQREAFAHAFEEARAREEADPAGSIAAYRVLIERQPGFAESHFRLARLLEAAGRYEEAYLHYIEARDLDGHPLRCLSSFQNVYREMANKFEAILIDGQAVFHSRHPHGMLDDYLFNDGFHPSLEGHVALAEAVLAALKARGAFGWPETTPTPRIDLTECAAHFDVGAATWKHVCYFARSFYDLTAPLRHDSTERQVKRERYLKGMSLLEAGKDADSLDLPGVGLRPVRLRISP